MNYLLFLIPSVFLVLSVIVSIRLVRKGKKNSKILAIQMLSFLFICVVCFATGFISSAEQTTPTDNTTSVSDTVAVSDQSKGLGLMAAAICTGIAGIGGGIAVGSAAPAAIGATSEDPKAFGKALIFVALGEGIALYGLLVSILILAKV